MPHRNCNLCEGSGRLKTPAGGYVSCWSCNGSGRVSVVEQRQRRTSPEALLDIAEEALQKALVELPPTSPTTHLTHAIAAVQAARKYL